MEKRKLPSVRVLRRLLDLDPDTGALIWKERPVWMFNPGNTTSQRQAQGWNTRYSGTEAGTLKDGYVSIRLFGRRYPAHHIVLAIHSGCWPTEEVDHENHDRSDNRPANLVPASRLANSRNLSMRSDNRSGSTGVFYEKRRSHWVAGINIDGRFVYLGSFTRKRDATRARRAAERKYGFHKNHGRR